MMNPFDDILPEKGSGTAVLEPPAKENPFDDIIPSPKPPIPEIRAVREGEVLKPAPSKPKPIGYTITEKEGKIIKGTDPFTVMGKFVEQHPLVLPMGISAPAFTATSLALSKLPRASRVFKPLLDKLPEEATTDLASLIPLPYFKTFAGKQEVNSRQLASAVLDSAQIVAEYLIAGKVEDVASMKLLENAVNNLGGKLTAAGYGKEGELMVSIPPENIAKVGRYTPSGESLLFNLQARRIKIPPQPPAMAAEEMAKAIMPFKAEMPPVTPVVKSTIPLVPPTMPELAKKIFVPEVPEVKPSITPPEITATIRSPQEIVEKLKPSEVDRGTIPGEPIEIYKEQKAALFDTEEGKYYIQREDGSYIRNPKTGDALFSKAHEAKEQLLEEVKPKVKVFREGQRITSPQGEGVVTGSYVNPMNKKRYYEIKTTKGEFRYLPEKLELIKPEVKPEITAPEVKKAKILKNVITVLPEEIEKIKGLAEEISAGEAGKRMPTEAGTWIGIASSFPDYFRDKGYTKKETLGIINKVLNNQPITEKQKVVFDDLLNGYKERLSQEVKAYEQGKQEDEFRAKLKEQGYSESDTEEIIRLAQEDAQSEVTTEGVGVSGTKLFKTPQEADVYINDIESKGGQAQIVRVGPEEVEVNYTFPETITPKEPTPTELAKKIFIPKGEALKYPKPEALAAKTWEVEMPKEPAGPKTINKTEIISWVEKAFKIPIKGKVTHRFKMAGMYYPKEEIVRLRKWGELEPMMHEIAHHLDAKVRKALGSKWRQKYVPYGEKKKAIGELASLDYDKKRRATKEGFAEYIRYYLTTDLAEKKAPTFHKYFTTYFLDANPDIRVKLDKLKGLMDTWQKQGAENRVIEQIDFKGEHTEVPGWQHKLEKTKDWILKNWNNEFYLMQKIEDEMGLKPGTGEKLRPSQDPFTLATYSKSKASVIARTFVMEKAIDETGNPVGPGLVEILKPIPDKQIKQLIAYGVSKKAIKLDERGIESGIDIDDAKYIAEKFKSDVWDKVLDEITAWNNHLLDWVVRAGGLGPDEAELMRELNPVYMPFKRAFLDEIQVIRGAGGSIVNKGQVVKAIKGSGRPILNPIEAMIGQATEFIAKSQKIRIARAIADLAEKEGVGGFITEVPAPMEATTFTLERLKDSLEQLGIEIGDADINSVLTVFTQGWQYRGKDNVVSIWKDGKRKFYEIHPDLYRAVSGVDQMQVGPILKLLSPFARLMRLGATGLRFAFGLARNPFRDAFTYALFSKRKFATIFDSFIGAYKEITAKPGDVAWRFKFGGGSLGGMMGYDRAANMAVYDEMLIEKLGPLKKVLKVAKHPIDSLRGLLSFWELAPRTMEVEGMYNKYKKEHPDWSEEDCFIQAFNDAQDVTVNFTKSGYYAKRVNAAAAFFNVAIRGPEKLFREIRANPIGIIIKGLLWITLPAILLWYKNRNKQWYKNLPPSYKYNNFFYELPDGTIVRLPIPFELGILFASVPLAALDTMIEKDPAYVEGLMQQIRMQVPDPTPTALEPLIEVWKNKDFLGRPIESEGMKFLPPTERSRYYTSEIAKQLSKGFNALGIEASPIQIDYLLNSYTGGGIQQIPLRPIKERADIPILGEVLQRMPERPQRQLNSFFSDYERLSQRKQVDIATRQELDKLKNLQYYYNRLIKWHFKDLRTAEEKKNLKKIQEINVRIQKELAQAGYD